MEPENHVLTVVAGHARSGASLPLVVVGSAPYGAAYEAAVRAAARADVRFLGGVWDQVLLDQLYAGALTYQHGHSVGGTNPSLLRAMGAGAATNAYDVVFNREVLGDQGLYWRDEVAVAELLLEAERDAEATIVRGKQTVERARAYDWDEVAASYEQLCERLARREFSHRRPTGRRSGLGTQVVPA
jgi:glycosyltransferase involved in cell wall biosynthesis